MSHNPNRRPTRRAPSTATAVAWIALLALQPCPALFADNLPPPPGPYRPQTEAGGAPRAAGAKQAQPDGPARFRDPIADPMEPTLPGTGTGTAAAAAPAPTPAPATPNEQPSPPRTWPPAPAWPQAPGWPPAPQGWGPAPGYGAVPGGFVPYAQPGYGPPAAPGFAPHTPATPAPVAQPATTAQRAAPRPPRSAGQFRPPELLGTP